MLGQRSLVLVVALRQTAAQGRSLRDRAGTGHRLGVVELLHVTRAPTPSPFMAAAFFFCPEISLEEKTPIPDSCSKSTMENITHHQQRTHVFLRSDPHPDSGSPTRSQFHDPSNIPSSVLELLVPQSGLFVRARRRAQMPGRSCVLHVL